MSTSNPRSRNLVHATPLATRPAQLPAIASLVTPDPALAKFAAAVREWLTVRGSSTNPFERWATIRELEGLGLRGGLVQQAVPGDALGLPVWTSRGAHQLVSLSALATSLQQFLSITGGTDAAQLAALRRKITAIQPGISEARANSLIRAAIEQLATALRQEIAAANDVSGIKDRLDAMESQSKRTAALVDRERGRVIEVTDSNPTWTVAHNLNRYPAVTVLDAAGLKVEADVTYDDVNNLTIRHGRAATGWVLLR